MSEIDVHGPIDFTVMEFPATGIGDGTVRALTDLVEAGIVRLYDLLVVATAADGTATEVELSGVAGLSALAGARSGLLGEEDVAEVGTLVRPGTTALVVVFENAWAIPFVAAARGEGGELIATERLTAQAIMDALDAADAAS